MKVRHAAALALTGWYLMVPPVWDIVHPGACKNDLHSLSCFKALTRFDANVPFRVWQQQGEFDRVADCHAEGKRQLDEAKSFARIVAEKFGDNFNNIGMTRQQVVDISYQAMLDRDSNLQCVATDDPRLKGD